MRGTGHKGSSTFVYAGITPACAGNSIALPASGLVYRDHPRVCGEQGDGEVDEVLLEGSPPRVRGTVGGVKIHEVCSRITPACAGNRVTQ